MDTAFLNRVGDTNAWVYGELNFYPDKVKWPWLRRIQAVHVQSGDARPDPARRRVLHDRGGRVCSSRGRDSCGSTGSPDTSHSPGSGSRPTGGAMQSNAQAVPLAACLRECERGARDLLRSRWRRTRAGRTTCPRGSPFSRAAVCRSRSISSASRSIANPPANASTRSTSSTRRPPISSPTISFSARIAQFDSSRSQVLTDFLSSYELRPGTVFYAGYGSLIEQRDFRNDAWESRAPDDTRRVGAASSSKPRISIASKKPPVGGRLEGGRQGGDSR